MNITLNKDFIETTYYKAFDHQLRLSDSKSVILLANTLFNEFVKLLGNKEIDLSTVIEKRQETEDNDTLKSNIINPHYRKSDYEDIFSDTRGWCWSCWKVKEIEDLKKKLNQYEQSV